MLILRKELYTLLFIFLGTAASLLVLTQRNNMLKQYAYSAMPTTPTPFPIETLEVDSQDSAKTLIVKKQKTESGANYSVFIVDKSNNADQINIGKMENRSQQLTIPYNSWSPDYNDVFLKEPSQSENNYLVFHTSGKPFTSDTQFINIKDLFNQKLNKYILEDVTGWAAPNLLIVNTKTIEDKEGPSFWFDLTTQSFIQLGTRFN